LVPIFELSKVHFIGSVCVPSSVELIHPWSFGPHGLTVAVFEWRSQLRQLNPESFALCGLRSLCVPASVESFDFGLYTFPSSLEVVTFESSTGVGDESSLSTDLFGRPAFLLGTGNRHLAVVGSAIMNFARSSLILYCGSSDVTIGSTVEEISPGCFFDMSMVGKLTFSAPSRLRFIRASAFAFCAPISLIVFPLTVEVIAERAFFRCRELQEVRFETGSQLQLIEEDAFNGCFSLGPIDVPSRATILGVFKVIAQVRDEDGSDRTRVQFLPHLRTLG
jgi:hypothetical protein